MTLFFCPESIRLARGTLKFNDVWNLCMWLLQQRFKQAVLGSVVLTDYNNRTYRVDDVDFSATPTSMFDWNGNCTSYSDYFSQVCILNFKKEADLHCALYFLNIIHTTPSLLYFFPSTPKPHYYIYHHVVSYISFCLLDRMFLNFSPHVVRGLYIFIWCKQYISSMQCTLGISPRDTLKRWAAYV